MAGLYHMASVEQVLEHTSVPSREENQKPQGLIAAHLSQPRYSEFEVLMLVNPLPRPLLGTSPSS